MKTFAILFFAIAAVCAVVSVLAFTSSLINVPIPVGWALPTGALACVFLFAGIILSWMESGAREREAKEKVRKILYDGRKSNKVAAFVEALDEVTKPVRDRQKYK